MNTPIKYNPGTILQICKCHAEKINPNNMYQARLTQNYLYEIVQRIFNFLFLIFHTGENYHTEKGANLMQLTSDSSITADVGFV